MSWPTHSAVLVALAAVGSYSFAIAQEPKQADDGQQQTANSIGMKLTLIPAGEFMMGCGESEEKLGAFLNATQGDVYSHDDDVEYDVALLGHERPQHRVRISKPFCLGTYHVTRGQFRQFVTATGYKTDAEKGNNPGAAAWNTATTKALSWRNPDFEQTDEHPVVCVSWNDATEFCNWLSRKEGKTYRLPTEAEWEYACRAGTKTRYYNGDAPRALAEVANVADVTTKEKLFLGDPRRPAVKASDGYVFTAPVGKFKPNAFGLYDMHGNAWQWCSDWYDPEYYGKSPKDDPLGPSSGTKRVFRGGSWLSPPVCARSAHRLSKGPDYRDDRTGFRVARTLP